MHYCKNCARFIPLRATENTLKKNAFYQCDPGTMAHDNFAKIAEYSAFADDERLVPKGGTSVMQECTRGQEETYFTLHKSRPFLLWETLPTPSVPCNVGDHP